MSSVRQEHLTLVRTADDGAVAVVRDHFAASEAAARSFFAAEAPNIASACRQMADRFDRGGKLMVFGRGAQASDAQHIAVEFIHPVVVGKRALPAISLTSDAAVLTGISATAVDDCFAAQVDALGSATDIALGLCGGDGDRAIAAALRRARSVGMLTVLVSGSATRDVSLADHAFGVAAPNELIAQELQETLYHVLWELVHVFFEARHAVNPLGLMTSSVDDRLSQAVEEVRTSIAHKSDDIMALRSALAAAAADDIARAGTELAARIARGGKLLAFGNGGSATDAQDVAADCLLPRHPGWQRVPALALTNDVGVLTAIANDVGYEHVFARQIEAFAAPNDVAVAFSTSGASPSVMRGLQTARARGLFTIALSGTGGGAVATSPAVDVCITVPADYVPRIQEAHATAWHAVLTVAQRDLARATGQETTTR